MVQQSAVSFECTPVREIDVDADGQSPTDVIIETVADVEGVDALALPPLADAIDPDVVDDFVDATESDSPSPAALCFSYSGWHVFVRRDGTIIVGDPTEMTTPTPLF